MAEPNSPQTGTSGLSDLKGKIGHVPFIRRNSFVYGFLSVLVLYALFLLPSSGSPEAVDLSRIILFCLLLLVWALIIFTDELKPEKMKTVTVSSIFIIAAWLYYRYSTARWGEMGFLFFNLEMIQKAWPTLVEGFWTTLLLAVCAAIMSTVIGLLLAVFRSFNNVVLNVFIIAYVDFFRAMPIIVLMMLIYYALPFMGIRLSAILSGILALGLNSSAYVSEIFRAGFLSIKKGQIEAANALGLNSLQTMRLVILPQAFRVVIPPLVGNYVASAKDTALASSISIIELLKAGLSQKSLLANPSPLIFVTALSNVTVSFLRNVMPSRIRMMVETLIIASYVIIVDMILKAYMPEVSRQLGPYVGLIITNCIIMGRAEAFALSNPPGLSFVDGIASAIGYSYVLVVIAIVRELMGSGSIWGYHILGDWWTNWSIMVMAPGAFFTLAIFIWVVKGIMYKREEGRNS